MKTHTLIDVTPENVLQETLFCIKDVKNPGFHCKQQWFEKQYEDGLRMKILKNAEGKMIGFIEYVPLENAWRPVQGPEFMFVHCMYIYPNKNKNKGYGSLLIDACEADAKSQGMKGICTMTSKGAWITDKRIFEKNGYREISKKDRFELVSKKWDTTADDPQFLDWTKQQDKYQGWHLLYADQCPWHEKSVQALKNAADQFGIDLNITKINTVEKAKQAPSGYGVFNLLRDGRLLEDHYLSETRFKNILRKELQNHE